MQIQSLKHTDTKTTKRKLTATFTSPILVEFNTSLTKTFTKFLEFITLFLIQMKTITTETTFHFFQETSIFSFKTIQVGLVNIRLYHSVEIMTHALINTKLIIFGFSSNGSFTNSSIRRDLTQGTD